MAREEYLFTSESVTEGHPDKIADQISDAVLDAILAPGSHRPRRLRDAAHHRAGGGGRRDHHLLLRRHPASSCAETIKDIGYTRAKFGFDCHTCGVIAAIDKQSPDIAHGRRQGGRGRPGADVRLRLHARPRSSCRCRSCSRTGSSSGSARSAGAGTLDYLRPDGKSQVSVRYRDGKPVAVETIVVSTQHADTSARTDPRGHHQARDPAGRAGRPDRSQQGRLPHQPDRPVRHRRAHG